MPRLRQGKKKSILTYRDLLRLHKCSRTVVSIAMNCRDDDVKKSLQEVAGILIGCVEFCQRLAELQIKRRKEKLDLDALAARVVADNDD